MLYRLPDGNWVDPRALIAISAADRVPDAYAEPISPRVIYRFRSESGGDSGVRIANCATYAEACKCRDELAAAANEWPKLEPRTVDEDAMGELVDLEEAATAAKRFDIFMENMQADGCLETRLDREYPESPVNAPVATGDRGGPDVTGGDPGPNVEFRKWT